MKNMILAIIIYVLSVLFMGWIIAWVWNYAHNMEVQRNNIITLYSAQDHSFDYRDIQKLKKFICVTETELL